MTRVPVVAIALALVVGGCGLDRAVTAPAPRTSSVSPVVTESLPPPPAGGFDPAVTIRFDGAPALTAEVARRPDQRSRGLMQRTSLAPTAGMVFLFPTRGTGAFYMLGTLIPLSIAYVDGDRVVSTLEMAPCPPGTDCPLYHPAGPYTVAVEAPARFFPDHGVRAGTRMVIEGRYTPPQA